MQPRAMGFLPIAALILSAAVTANAQYGPTVSKGGAQYTVPPTPDGLAPPGAPFDKHDISGKWNRVSPFETYSNIPGGVPTGKNGIDGDGGQHVEEAPFTLAGRAAFEKNLPSYGRRQVPPRLGNDPQMMCDPMGVPRILNGQVKGPHATFEVVTTPGRIIELVQWHHQEREIWTDGRALPKLDDELDRKWNGYSVGHWDGDTFVVNSVGFDERTWLDHNGYPHTADMRLEERYRRVDANTLELQMSVTDPEYYSKPFKSDLKRYVLDRVGVKGWDEQIYCAPSDEFKFDNLLRDAGVGKISK